MNISELRSQFRVFVFLEELSLTTEIKQSFATSGYEAYMFIDQETLIDRVRQAAPHVILFSPDILVSTLSEFTQLVLRANPEIQFICVAPTQDAEGISEYREFGFAQILEPGHHMHVRALWAVDSVCEKLALTYQNESLVEQVERLQAEQGQKAKALVEMESRLEGEKPPPISELLERFQRASSKEDLIINFLRWLGSRVVSKNAKCVYFKFLPTVMSFVATQGHQVDLERTKGIGAKLSPDEMKALMNLTLERKIPDSLQTLMKEAFKADRPFSFSLMLKNQVEGLFIFFGFDEGELPPGFAAEFLLFQVCYQNAHYQRRTELLENTDPVTDLFNQNYFFKRLEEEIARARRISKAVSIVKIGIDHFQDLEKALGLANRDLILRSIASLVKKTSRTNDYSCRTGEDEISLILPHCSRKGAALRAERLRRAIESHSFAINGVHITVSSGVSEYPSLSKSAEDLDFSSSQALNFIAQRGGNKVCLYKPAEDFKPDFDVPLI